MKTFFKLVLQGVFIMALVLPTSVGTAEMIVTTKDGRKFTLPVEGSDVKRIEYSDGQSQTAPGGGLEIAGTWNWVAGQTLVVHGNGSIEVFDGSGNKINDGRWELLDAANRRYRFTHRAGGWVDTVSLSLDGRSLDGTNNHGSSIHGSRR